MNINSNIGWEPCSRSPGMRMKYTVGRSACVLYLMIWLVVLALPLPSGCCLEHTFLPSRSSLGDVLGVVLVDLICTISPSLHLPGDDGGVGVLDWVHCPLLCLCVLLLCVLREWWDVILFYLLSSNPTSLHWWLWCRKHFALPLPSNLDVYV